jgi:hypothetical protein
MRKAAAVITAFGMLLSMSIACSAGAQDSTLQSLVPSHPRFATIARLPRFGLTYGALLATNAASRSDDGRVWAFSDDSTVAIQFLGTENGFVTGTPDSPARSDSHVTWLFITFAGEKPTSWQFDENRLETKALRSKPSCRAREPGRPAPELSGFILLCVLGDGTHVWRQDMSVFDRAPHIVPKLRARLEIWLPGYSRLTDDMP